MVNRTFYFRKAVAYILPQKNMGGSIEGGSREGGGDPHNTPTRRMFCLLGKLGRFQGDFETFDKLL